MSTISFTHPNSNSYKYVSVGIYTLIVVFSALTGKLSALFQLFWYSLSLAENFSTNPIDGLAQLQSDLADVLLPIGAVALGVMVFVSRSRKVFFWSNLSWAIFVMPLTWATTYFYVNQTYPDFQFTPELILFRGLGDATFGYLLIFLVVASCVLAFLAKKHSFDETVAEPIQKFSGEGSSQLPLLTVICAFVFPVVGIVTGHMALNQIKTGRISPDNKNLTNIGLVLSYVFSVVGLIALFSVLSWIAALNSWRSY